MYIRAQWQVVQEYIRKQLREPYSARVWARRNLAEECGPGETFSFSALESSVPFPWDKMVEDHPEVEEV